MYVYMIGLKGFRYGFGFTSKVELFTIFTESEKLQHESNNPNENDSCKIREATDDECKKRDSDHSE